MANDTDLPQSEVEDPDAGIRVDGLFGTNASPPRFGRLVLCVATASALAFGVLGTVAYGVWFNHDQQTYAEAIAGARQALSVPASASAVAAGRLAKSVTSTRPPVSAAAPRSATTTVATTSSAPMTTATVETAAPAPAVAAATSSGPATMTPTPSPAQAALASEDEEGGKRAVWSGPIAQAPVAAASETALADATPADTTLADATPAALAPLLPSTRRAINSPDPAAKQSTAGRSGKDTRIAQQERRASTANARHKSNVFARMGLFFRRVNYRQHDSGRQQKDIYSHP